MKKRQVLFALLSKGFEDLKAVSMPSAFPGIQPSYWFLRLRFHPDKVACDKEMFCQALAAEGMPVNANYSAMPHTYDWYKNCSVFGTSGYPWTSPRYKGDPNRQFPCPNAMAAIRRHFNLAISESWNNEDAVSIVTAFKKVEAAFLK